VLSQEATPEMVTPQPDIWERDHILDGDAVICSAPAWKWRTSLSRPSSRWCCYHTVASYVEPSAEVRRVSSIRR
jgi:hypothetical protein